MAQVEWTLSALDELNDIGDYLSKNSPNYASYLIQLIWDRTKLLENTPKLGRVVPETNILTIRELIVKNYRIIYSVPDKDNVNILAIRHSSQSLKEI